jgi:gluconolactonase
MGAAMPHAEQPVGDALKDLVPDLTVIKLADEMKFIEGPVWVDREGGYLIFSDIPANEFKKWTPASSALSTFRTGSNGTNGNTLDLQGRLISCEHTSRRVTRTEPDGSITVLADNYKGKKLNSPNDVVVKSDGSIWFTDPPYGIDKKLIEQEHNYVFHLDPDSRRLDAVASDFDMPNGLCFSPDEKKLYIADSGKPHHIRVFDAKNDGTLAGGHVFAVITPGAPDGIRCDAEGNVWSSAGHGVHILSPDGKLIGKIPVPETPANLCFGGADGQTLFITARTSLYQVRVNVTSPGRPPKAASRTPG